MKLMKLIFLHGVGQTSQAWHQVVEQLPAYDCRSLDLLDEGKLPTFSMMQDRVRQAIREANDRVVLVGLSLGAMLALSLLEEPESNLAGVVSIAGQYRFVANKAYRFQVGLVKLLPHFIFAKQGLDKRDLLDFYKDLATLDMTDFLKTNQIPALLVCGDKDKVNLKTARELANLMPQSELRILTGAGHEVNKDQPIVLATQLQSFLRTL